MIELTRLEVLSLASKMTDEVECVYLHNHPAPMGHNDGVRACVCTGSDDEVDEYLYAAGFCIPILAGDEEDLLADA